MLISCAFFGQLADYYNRVSTHPKKDERVALAERIRRIPGCEDYNEAKVNNYFANRRTADKARPGQRAGPTSSGDIRQLPVVPSGIKRTLTAIYAQCTLVYLDIQTSSLS